MAPGVSDDESWHTVAIQREERLRERQGWQTTRMWLHTEQYNSVEDDRKKRGPLPTYYIYAV
jgi:hypothetical protein